MAQEEIQKQRQTIIKTAPKEPRKHRVTILNDDFTTFEFVIMVLVSVFRKTEQEAMEIAETTHTKQKATVGSYSKDIAESRVARATEMARAEGFPLKFDIQAG